MRPLVPREIRDHNLGSTTVSNTRVTTTATEVAPSGHPNVTITITRLPPSATPTLAPSTYNLRVQSWNLRSAFLLKHYDPISKSLNAINSDTGVPTSDDHPEYYWNWKENSWSVRRVGLTQHVEFFQPEVFAVQEALDFQISDLDDLLPGYDWIGVGRDNNKTGGEYEAVFYNKNKVNVTSWDTFWLSDTPLTPSKLKCASAKRDATVVHFVTQSNGIPFTVINTHWDDKCDAARRLAALLLKYRAAYEFEKTKSPVILTGDFNSEAYGPSRGGYEILTGASESVPINAEFSKKYNSSIKDSFVLQDSFLETPPANRIGHFATYTGFYSIDKTSKFTRIDFHMSGKNTKDNSTNGVSSTRYYVPDVFSDVGFHLSDHRTVISEYLLKK